MPPRGVKKGSKWGRMYEHVKESERQQGGRRDRAEATDLGIDGRSKMNKRQLIGAVEEKKRGR
jgi:hypothetical protein